jgi:hypothetical protein
VLGRSLSRRSNQLALPLLLTALVVTGLSACTFEESKVIIQTGVNAGKKYTPALVGGLTAEQCVQQGICIKQ